MKSLHTRKKIFEIFKRGFKVNSLSHLYIFYGPKGAGKKTFSKEIAKSLLCHTSQNSGNLSFACENCISCRQFDRETHPDFFFFGRKEQKDEKGKWGGIKYLREDNDIIGKISGSPTLSTRKIFIVPEIEKFSKDALSYCLKVFEEPGENTIILATTDSIDRVLDTIISRSLPLPFFQLSKNRAFTELEKDNSVPTNDYENLYWKSFGLPGGLEKSKTHRFQTEEIPKNRVAALDAAKRNEKFFNENRQKFVSHILEDLNNLSFDLKNSDRENQELLKKKMEKLLFVLENIERSGNAKLNTDLYFLSLIDQ